MFRFWGVQSFGCSSDLSPLRFRHLESDDFNCSFDVRQHHFCAFSRRKNFSEKKIGGGKTFVSIFVLTLNNKTFNLKTYYLMCNNNTRFLCFIIKRNLILKKKKSRFGVHRDKINPINVVKIFAVVQNLNQNNSQLT